MGTDAERDEWKARAEQAERELRQARAEVAEATRTCREIEHKLVDIQSMHDDTVRTQRRLEARTAPAVTRDDIGNALMWVGVSNGVETHTEVSVGTDAVWSLVSGSDPAVHVVRESDVATVKVERTGGKWVADGEAVASVGDEPVRARGPIAQYMKWAVWAEAVARAIEAEAAVDPVEAKARELWESTISHGATVAPWDDAHEDAQSQFRILARYVLGQEAGDE